MPSPSSSSPDPRGLNLTGWTGEHPLNGRDIGHLLLFPTSGAVTEGMPLVAEALGLVAVSDTPGSPPVVLALVARVALDGDVAHVLYGASGGLSRPVDPGWIAAAKDQGVVMITCGVDRWSGSDRAS